jgi:hypothetical protein
LRFIAYEEPYFYEIGDVANTLTTKYEFTTNYICGKIDNQYDNLNSGVNNEVFDIQFNELDNCLYAGGRFDKANGTATTVNSIAKYDGSTWSALGSGLSGGFIYAYKILFDAEGNVYVCGDFTSAGGSGANYIAKWNGSAWSALGTGLDGVATGMIIDPDNGDIIVVGSFANAGGSSASRIARWDGSAWSQFSADTFNNQVSAIVRHPNGDIFIGGSFTEGGGAPSDYVSRWDGASWNDVGTGMNNYITRNSLIVSDTGVLYAGGAFTSAGGTTANRIASWNGSVWSALGSGANDVVYAIGTKDNLVYAGGRFTNMGGVSVADKVAVWNGSTWSNLDIDIPTSPYFLAVQTAGDDSYYGFSGSGTSSASYLNTIVNNGTRSGYPKIVISRSGGTTAIVKYLKNETTGATLYLDYSLLDGEELTIDLTEGGRSIKSSLFRNVWQAGLRSSDFANFFLLPGTNYVSVFVNETGSPTITAYMQWRNTHWSADGVAP